MSLHSTGLTTGLNRLLKGLAAVLVVTTSGCAVSLLSIMPKVALVPKDLLLRHVVCPTTNPSTPQNFQILGTHEWQDGMIVLYSAICLQDTKSSQAHQVVGHQIVKLDGIHWQVKASQSYQVKTQEKDSKKLIDYRIGRSKVTGRDRYTVLYGQVLKPNVGAVEATFNNGEILRDESDGVFALVASGASGVCQIRILGRDNQILQQENLAPPRKPKKTNLPYQCLPVTQQL